MNAMRELNQREAVFAVHYTAIGSETFNDGTKSAIEAGYSEKSAHVAASRLLKRDNLRKRILELHQENMKRNMITVDKVLADLEHDKLLARKAHQYAVAKGCTELQGKYLAMFTDNVKQTGEGLTLNFTTTTPREKTPEERRLQTTPETAPAAPCRGGVCQSPIEAGEEWL